MDAQQLIIELDRLRPGEQVVYFTGFLDFERQKNPTPEEVRVANIAYALSQQRKVVLTQRRLGPPVYHGMVDWRVGVGCGFEYIATGALPPKAKEWT